MSKLYLQHDYKVTGKDYVETEGGDTPAGGISYSTEEQDTGLKWIDDKPVYQKVISAGALPNATSSTVAHGITGLDTLIWAIGCSGSEAGNHVPIPYTNVSAASGQASFYVSATNIIITTGENMSQYINTYFVLQYTKSE